MTRRATLLLAGLILGGCASARPVQDPRSPLEIRALQTRGYDTSDRRQLTHAVVEGLRDAGFQVRNVDSELGLLTATLERTEVREAPGIVKALFWYPSLIPFRGWLKKRRHVFIEATVSIDEHGTAMGVRVSCQSKQFDDVGRLLEVRSVDDGRFYQELFARIDKAFFIERQGL